ncbi:MAG: metallophosphoesterase family protein [Nocardioides sp.]
MHRTSRITLAAIGVTALAGVLIPLGAFASGNSTAAACATQLRAAAGAQEKVGSDHAALVKAAKKKARTARARALKAAAIDQATAALIADQRGLAAAQSAVISCQGSLPTPTATVTATVTATATATATATVTQTVVAPPPALPSSVIAVVGDTACEPDTADNDGNPQAIKCDGASIGENPATGPTSQTLGMAGAYATVDEIEGWHPVAVPMVGDEQYQVGKLSDFQQSFDKTYGAIKYLLKPAPGNHEFYGYSKKGDAELPQNGAGYFGYFNGVDADGDVRAEGQAGGDSPQDQGWYSYDIGQWHFISLNAECGAPAFGGNGSAATTANCDPAQGLAKAETDWLKTDLAADQGRCTVAYWHQPTFTASAGGSLEGSELGKAWWRLLYAHGHAIVLNGHEHLYARFAPQDPDGNADPVKGIRQFTVGTGGEALDTLKTGAADVNQFTLDPATGTYAPGHVDGTNLEVGEASAFGAMRMTLSQDGTGHYSWDFEPSAMPSGADASTMSSYADMGSATC